jgi:hypothetical protein
MATSSLAPNPFVGSSWDTAGPPPTMPGLTPLTFPETSRGFDPGNFANPKGSKELQQNMGITNILAAQQKNQLAPQFAKLMSQYGGDAGAFFKQLMDLGSPYYKQKQTEAATQGVARNEEARRASTEQVRAEGYGSTPSGASAAMIGGEAVAGAQSLAEQYLQNLFQNEQTQFAGAQGEQALAQLFNPTQLLGGTATGMSQSTTSPSFFQDLNQTLSGVGSLFGAKGIPTGK